jgi:hypothetical protein
MPDAPGPSRLVSHDPLHAELVFRAWTALASGESRLTAAADEHTSRKSAKMTNPDRASERDGGDSE